MGKEAGEGFGAGGFAEVVAFPGEFGACVGDGFVEVETFGEEAGGGEEQGEVVEVGGDGGGNARVLYFYGHGEPGGGQDRAVDLADGGGGHGDLIEAGEQVAPFGAEVGPQDGVALGGRHVVGGVLNS